MKKTNRAFSLIELSIVILIIGIIVAGVTQSSSLVRKFKLTTARSLTQGSPVHGTKDLILWLDATSETSFSSQNDGALIATWNDVSSQSNTKINLIQPTDNLKPSYKENGINGLPSVLFSGDFLAASNFPIASANYSAFIVFSSSGNSSAPQDIITVGYDNDSDLNNSSAATGIMFEINPFNYVRVLYRSNPINSGGDSNTSSLAITPNNNQILSYVRNLSSGYERMWMNNTIFLNTVPTKAFFEVSPLFITIGKLVDKDPGGDVRFFFGQISEVIIFDRALSAEETDSIEGYLSKKYSIKLN